MILDFLSFILESAVSENHHLTFTRMASGPTDAHLDLGNAVKSAADKEGASHEVVLSRSHDGDKNPLPPETKLKHAKRAMKGVNVRLASSDAPSFLHHASKLHAQGVRNLTLHHGSDEEEMVHTLRKYNGKEGRHGHYNFDSINGKQLGGEREAPKDENDVRKSTLSGSRLRKAAREGKKDLFKKMAASTLSDKQKEEMYHDNRKGMGVE